MSSVHDQDGPRENWRSPRTRGPVTGADCDGTCADYSRPHCANAVSAPVPLFCFPQLALFIADPDP